MNYGTMIERGIVTAIDDAGYTVQSYDRMGIVTPPIKPIDDTTYTKGQSVYFFLFCDGTGKIICGL